ncbi:MAG: hypothetical protein ACJ75L_06585 [Gaiellaceae bacterium]
MRALPATFVLLVVAAGGLLLVVLFLAVLFEAVLFEAVLLESALSRRLLLVVLVLGAVRFVGHSSLLSAA